MNAQFAAKVLSRKRLVMETCGSDRQFKRYKGLKLIW